MRPWSFSMSAISVSVGAAFAATHGSFSWSLYLLSAVAMIALHGGVNLMNDFFDYRSRLLYSDRAFRCAVNNSFLTKGVCIYDFTNIINLFSLNCLFLKLCSFNAK